MVKKNETKLVCPNCGAEFEIAQHECKVKNATVIGADSGLGTIYMKLKDRQEQLTKAGVDISKYFSMKTPSGDEKLMKWDGDTPIAVTADDPVLKAIMESGTVPNRDLFRRWVMAQVFQGLSYSGYYGKGFTDWVHTKGYEYTWKMAVEEFRVQAKLWKKDKENFRERNRWFNKEVALEMISDYVKKLQMVVRTKKEKNLHKCKGVPYICIGGKNVFCSDIDGKLFWPLRRLELNVSIATDPVKMSNAFDAFNSKRVKLTYNEQFCSRWMDAYKGAGAFYTMKNMVLFHGCLFRGDNGRFMSKAKSLEYLEDKAMEYASDGWRLFGLMKKLIEDNGINIAAKRREWAEKKLKR